MNIKNTPININSSCFIRWDMVPPFPTISLYGIVEKVAINDNKNNIVNIAYNPLSPMKSFLIIFCLQLS